MMNLGLIGWWLVVGWCATPWTVQRRPRPPLPRAALSVILRLVGAVLGGWVFLYLWPPAAEAVSGVYVAASALPAAVGARVFTSLLGVTALGPQPIPPGDDTA